MKPTGAAGVVIDPINGSVQMKPNEVYFYEPSCGNCSSSGTYTYGDWTSYTPILVSGNTWWDYSLVQWDESSQNWLMVGKLGSGLGDAFYMNSDITNTGWTFMKMYTHTPDTGYTYNLSSSISPMFIATDGNGKFIIIGEGATARMGYYYSSSITGWTYNLLEPLGSDYYNTSLFYGNGKWVWVGRKAFDTYKIMYSTDQINWTLAIQQSGTSIITCGYYADGKYVFANRGNLLTTTDFVNWNVSTRNASDGRNDTGLVTFGCGMFVSYEGSWVSKSCDGITWYETPGAAEIDGTTHPYWSYYLYNYKDNKFLSMSFYNAGIITSYDGYNWITEKIINGGWTLNISGNDNYIALIDGQTESLYYQKTT